jgi:hypothetical protein
MMKIPMSPAAAALLRALLGRAGVSRERVLLTALHSVDWQSLTFVGERHEIALRVPGPDAAEIVDRLTADLENAEFHIPGQIVADIMLKGDPQQDRADSAITIDIEALTIAE